MPPMALVEQRNHFALGDEVKYSFQPVKTSSRRLSFSMIKQAAPSIHPIPAMLRLHLKARTPIPCFGKKYKT